MVIKFGIGSIQVLFFTLVFWIMNGLATWFQLKIPGSILGLMLVFLLLQFKLIKVEWVDIGSKWLLAEMLLFFIPPAAGMIQFKSLLLSNGLQIALLIGLTSIIVMLSTGFVTQSVSRRKERAKG